MTTVAVLIPSYGRASQMAQNVGALLAQTMPAGVEMRVVLAIPDDDWDSFIMASQMDVLFTPRPAGTTAVQGWNAAYQMIGADWYVLGADDIVWRVGWLAQALAVAEKTGAQVVGLSDGGHTNLDEYAPHYMASREFCETQLGGNIAPPEYKSWWFDREVCERAQALGVYAPAPDAWAEHMHPDWKMAPMDKTYKDAWQLHDVDRALYMQRKETAYASKSA